MTPRRYQVRALLGEGAFGSVYLARSIGTGLQRDVAIKVLKRDRTSDAGVVRRLRDEARMLALIRHRAIVRVDDLVELDGCWSIVMEYVEGCDIASLLAPGPAAAGGPFPPRVALAIAEEVANALHAASVQPGPDGAPLRLIHRDIKPSNVRLTAQGEVKLLDFGVARADFAEREAGTTQTAYGTIVYMSPERFEGRDTPAADVYALGVTLFAMLTGVPPGRIASDPDRQPPGGRLAAQWAGIAAVSTDLHALIAGMLAYDPERRPTARECARALGDLCARVGGERLDDWAARVVPARIGENPPAADARSGTLLVEGRAPPAEAPPGRGGSRWLVAGVASVLVFAVMIASAGAAWWVYRDGRPAAPVTTAGANTDATVSPLAAAIAAREAMALPEEPAAGAAGGGGAPVTGVPDGAGGALRGALPPPQEEGAPSDTPVRVEGARSAEPRTPKPDTGTVRLAGDPVSAHFVGANGRFEGPGALPAGVYAATVTFEGGASVTIESVMVNAGAVTTLRCDAVWSNCAATVTRRSF